VTGSREIFVGGLPPDADEQEVRTLFSRIGVVEQVTLIRETETGRSRGFGFVLVPDACAQAMIDGLDGLELRDHRVRVNEARDKSAPAPRRRY
jgi:RNA recognition motif-containing protein